MHQVRPYIEDLHPGLASEAVAEVLNPDKKMGRLSCHVYDLHRMWTREDLRARVLAAATLLDAVVRNKRTYFKEGKAKYELLDGYVLNATPHEALEVALRADYAAMTTLFFPGTPVPKFADLLGTLREIDHAVAAMRPGGT